MPGAEVIIGGPSVLVVLTLEAFAAEITNA
jgi:hypothetical protein